MFRYFWQQNQLLAGLGLILVLFLSCQPYRLPLGVQSPPVSVVAAGPLTQDTRWQGTVRVEGLVQVPKAVTLEIAPGTRVEFSFLDTDQDGIGESGLYVEGRVLAVGTVSEPIVFTGSQDAPLKPSAWGEIKIEHSPRNRFTYCQFSYAYWALHMHYSGVEINHSLFEQNYGGLKFRSGPISIQYCQIQNNQVGIRFLASEPVIKHNEIRYNQTGIFIRENVRHPTITYNNFGGNQKYHISLGENQSQDISCPYNWWGTEDPEVIEHYLFDKQDRDYLGRVRYQPIYIHYQPIRSRRRH